MSLTLPLFLRGLALIVALLPWSALRWAGALLGWIAGSVLRIRRRAVVAAMRRASVGDAERESRAMYAGLGTGLFELLWLAGSSPDNRAAALREHVALDSDLDDAIRAAGARGPVILAASHTANWELIAFGAAQAFARRGKRLAVVTKPISVGAFSAFCTHLRTACGLVLLAPQGALANARRSLEAGDIVAMPIDQVPDRTRHGVAVSFLGAPALADRAPAALTRSVGGTLIVVGASRDGLVQRAHLLATLKPPPEGGAAWVLEATAQATDALDAFVRLHPSSWLWLHRRWRAPLEVAAGVRLVATGHPG